MDCGMASENRLLMGQDRMWVTYHWHMVGLFFMPRGRTSLWYLLSGACLLREEIEKTKWGQPGGEVWDIEETVFDVCDGKHPVPGQHHR